MKRIGIELNGIIRNINAQMLKYYKKDIDKKFNEEVNLNVNDFIKQLPFKSDKERKNFLYIDYPYEIYGCANEMSRNLLVILNQWIEHLNDVYENEEYVLCFFSLEEEALTIQSTYFFLSKTGSRIRFFYLPDKGEEDSVWDNFDIVVTSNKNVIKSKPNNKKCILIKKDDIEIKSNVDYIYSDLLELINDENFVNDLSNDNNIKISFYNKLKSKLRKLFNRK